MAINKYYTKKHCVNKYIFHCIKTLAFQRIHGALHRHAQIWVLAAQDVDLPCYDPRQPGPGTSSHFVTALHPEVPPRVPQG